MNLKRMMENELFKNNEQACFMNKKKGFMDRYDVDSAKFYVVEKNIINDPVFDLIPGRHGHFMDKNRVIQEVDGIRITVPLLNVNYETLRGISNFVDEMAGTVTHEIVTIVIKEEGNSPAKIGVYAL
jgi:hypothetical protein